MYFDSEVVQNRAIIEVIRKLETQILLQYANFTNKRRQSYYGLYNQLLTKKLRINDASSSKVKHVLLNISGVWENDTQFGITYKWVEGNHF